MDVGDTTFMDKENMEPLSPMKIDDLSFYENESPQRIECDASPNRCNHNAMEMVEDFDLNSQDSGYGATYNPTLRRFVSFTSPGRSSKASFGSLGSNDDDFLESMSDFEPIDENLPVNFKTLINGELSTMTENVSYKMSPPDSNSFKPLFRRALSLHNESSTPNTRKVRSCLFKGAEVRPFKRPEPPIDEPSPFQNKRSKVFTDKENTVVAKPVLKRAFSASEETIKYAVQRSAEEELIGDYSRTYTLPLTQGRHQDLKSITSETLARLMKGEFNDTVASYKVIDCRYPYEFNGGHIDGALNIYMKEQCLELLNQCNLDDKDDKVHILIFHCEFSSERGPNL